MSETIYFHTKTMPFWGLSKFAPPGIQAQGVYWPTVEHYFQAQKFVEPIAQEKIRTAATPKQARTLGQSRNYTLRGDWEAVREQIMFEALSLKFKNADAKALLLSTGNRHLVEASPFDYFWAAGQDGSGQNRLGYLLMRVRLELVRSEA